MPRLTALSKSRRLAIRRIPRCAPAPFSHQHSSFQPVSAESPMRAQTQAAQWLQGEFDSFDTTTLPFTSFVKFQSQLWHLGCLSPVVESQKKILRRMAMEPVIKFYIPLSFHMFVMLIMLAGRG